MNDALLFIGILIFLFIVWLYAGGPTRPISFAGPYLTPPTTSVDSSQEQYWPNYSDNEYESIGPGEIKWWGFGLQDASPNVNLSPFADVVELRGGNAAAEDVAQEYVVIESRASAPLSITGWRLVSNKTGASITISYGSPVASRGGSLLTNITLREGMQALIHSGYSPVNVSFQETKCTGYLNAYLFTPPLSSHACPTPLNELSAYYVGNAERYDQCAEFVQGLPACVDTGASPNRVPASCQSFVDTRLTYAGCVDAHVADDDFYGSVWHVYAERSKQLWRSSGESILLLDASGKLVDRYSY